MQSSWWADFRATTGYSHFGAVHRVRNVIYGGAVVLKFSHAPDTCFYYIPEGPVLPDNESAAEEIFEATLEAIEERRRADSETVSHLRMEPRWDRMPAFVRGFHAIPAFQDRFMEPRNTLCIDLRPTEAAILAQMKPKGRYNIGVARRHGVSVVEDASAQGLADFLELYDGTAERQGFGAKPPEYFETLLGMLTELNRGSLFFAEYQGRRLAGAIVVFFGPRATYFFGGSLESDRHVMAPYLLHFEIMRAAKARGHEWYDFWGVAPDDGLDHPWRNISLFKHKFGGSALDLVPTLDHIYDPPAYDYYLATGGDPGDD
jgi:lipid II:glycine glycyltransferase (peptidoglycan interpeptide bridge formation enzyme)